MWLTSKVDKKTGKKYPHGCIAKNRVDDLISTEIDQLSYDFDNEVDNFNYGFQDGVKYVLNYLQ